MLGGGKRIRLGRRAAGLVVWSRRRLMVEGRGGWWSMLRRCSSLWWIWSRMLCPQWDLIGASLCLHPRSGVGPFYRGAVNIVKRAVPQDKRTKSACLQRRSQVTPTFLVLFVPRTLLHLKLAAKDDGTESWP